MSRTVISLESIITDLARENHLTKENAFTLWSLLAFIVPDLPSARKALVNGPRDKGLDAIFVDFTSEMVHLVQSKLRSTPRAETRSEAISFAGLSRLSHSPKSKYDAYFSKLRSQTAEALCHALKAINDRSFQLTLWLISTGRWSPTLRDDANAELDGDARLEFRDGMQCKSAIANYILGIAPQIPAIDLSVAADNVVAERSIFHAKDRHLEAFAFSMYTEDLGEVYKRNGPNIFARNIRGFLGKETKVNQEIANTLIEEPERFWYYNNGITILCDRARLKGTEKRKSIEVENAQIINGQQTTRMAAELGNMQSTVLVRVLVAPIDGSPKSSYEALLTDVVKATNWQTAISISDLCVNDLRQIRLEQRLSVLGYQYIRKQETRREASKRRFDARFQVSKFDLAKAVAACDLPDSSALLKGKEHLFRDWYDDIFPEDPVPNEFLSRYWLMRYVIRRSKTNKKRFSYEKWVVLHSSWADLKKHLRNATQVTAFIRYAERTFRAPNNNPELDELPRPYFTLVDEFYRKERESAEENRPSFFKKSGLDGRFKRFRSGKKREMIAIEKALTKVHDIVTTALE